MAGEGTGHGVPWGIGPGRSQLSLGPARGGSELTPPWTLRLSPGHGASFAALPALWPIFHGPIPASFPELGVGAGGPTQRQEGREAARLSVCIPGLVSGTAQRVEHSSGGSPARAQREHGLSAAPPSAPGQPPALSDAPSNDQAPVCRGLSVSQNWAPASRHQTPSTSQTCPGPNNANSGQNRR